MLRNLKNLSTVLKCFSLHYTLKIKFFAQIVIITFSDRPMGRQDNRMNSDVTKSKLLCEHDVTKIITTHRDANLIFFN